MNETEILIKLESLYFENRYMEIIEFWEVINPTFTFDFKSEIHSKILEAIKVSYYELGDYSKSRYYLEIQIKQLDFLNLSKLEKENKLRYYFLDKVNILTKQNKKVVEYRTIWEYLKNKTDEAFLQWSNSIEEHFYRKFVLFNKVMRYVFIVLIIIVIILHLSNIFIISSIYMTYNIISIICLIWIILNYIYPARFKSIFLKGLRFILKP